MNKNILLIIVVVIGVVAVAAWFLMSQTSMPEGQPGPEGASATLDVAPDLTPLPLSQEELDALKEAGLTPPQTGEDMAAKSLQTVQQSDEINAIIQDIEGTDLQGLDAELQSIEGDLQGL